MYEIHYYSEKNKYPVFEFISSQSPKEQAKILREIDLLSEFGLSLGMPHIKKIQGIDALWELRIKHSSNIFRIFYFHFVEGKFVLLHAIRKTTTKTPKKELSIAVKRRNHYLKGSE
nr:type II toxin-antitoxin system RelE/ParE family toxin [Alkaliphilus metalliredigens]